MNFKEILEVKSVIVNDVKSCIFSKNFWNKEYFLNKIMYFFSNLYEINYYVYKDVNKFEIIHTRHYNTYTS